MTRQSNWLARFLPSPSAPVIGGEEMEKGYTYFSRGLSVLLMVLVLVPLTIVSIISHYQYKELLQKEELVQLLLNVEQAQSTIEEFVERLQSVVKFVARDDRYEELLDPRELRALFVRLKSEYSGLADIEVIDSKGMQKSYIGPYQLKGNNYTDQTWYKEVISRGVYISNVFSGFRNVPHFVIAVSRKHANGRGSWVLRVTIEEKTLQDFIDTISTTLVDDMFLVDHDLIAQTEPKRYGRLGERCILHSKEAVRDSEFEDVLSEVMEHDLSTRSHLPKVAQKEYRGQNLLHTAVDLENTPWRLVIVKEQYLYGQDWIIFRIRLLTIFFTSTIVGIFIAVGLSSGITEHIKESDRKRRQFYGEAEHANKLASIGRLAAGVAHEINNPLSIINQKTGLVQDFMEMSHDFHHRAIILEALDGVQDSVERCKTITHRLLGFARQTDVLTEEIDINGAIREVIDFLAKEATYNQIRIKFELADGLKKISSDRGQLQQILLNITNNAIDAIGSDGEIILASKQIDDDWVQVRITDNGPGMSPEVQKRIFDPFFTTKETGKGTGLGLSITYGLLKKLGGYIEVISSLGEGTTFEINLPVNRKKEE